MASEDLDRQLALSLANGTHIEILNAAPLEKPLLMEITTGSTSMKGVEANVPTSTHREGIPTQNDEASFSTCLQLTKDSLRASDMRVVCGVEYFEVHRAIICPQSGFFAAAVSGGFMESTTGSVTLNEECTQTVERLMSFFYTGDYGDLTSSRSSPFYIHKTGSTYSVEQRHEELLLHSTMYACATRYDVGNLKKLAESNFKRLFCPTWPLKNLPALVAEVYNSTPPNDRGLRDSILEKSSDHIDEMVTGSLWAQIVEVQGAGQLALDLLPLVLISKNTSLAVAEDQVKDQKDLIDDLSSPKKKKKKACEWRIVEIAGLL
ncbi:MAG: hypothetical protein Q9184_007010 [Pyrenodesmia sp. 2 TL-2023]